MRKTSECRRKLKFSVAPPRTPSDLRFWKTFAAKRKQKRSSERSRNSGSARSSRRCERQRESNSNGFKNQKRIFVRRKLRPNNSFKRLLASKLLENALC